MSCNAIAATVTSCGQKLIEQVIDVCERGTPEIEPVKIVYGDTDSVFYVPLQPVAPGPLSLLQATEFAVKLATYITEVVFKQFPTIVLEFEKIFWRCLMMGKKKYTANCYTDDVLLKCLAMYVKGTPLADIVPHLKSKFVGMGIETKRRDNALIVRQAMRAIIDATIRNPEPCLSVDQCVDECVTAMRPYLDQLVASKPGAIDYEVYAITRSLRSSYVNVPAHVHAVMRQEKRVQDGLELSVVPQSGDRVKYVFENRSKGQKKPDLRQQAQTFGWALQQQLPIDRLYYLEQLKKPILRLTKYFTQQDGRIENLFLQTERRIQGIRSLTAMFGGDTTLSRRKTPAKKKQKKKHVTAKNNGAGKMRDLRSMFGR
jgi:DNA polymerase elongation subunit (family B)